MRKEKAITLISLVITIIILIILAGVAVNLSLGENGIFRRAKEARDVSKINNYKERINLIILEAQIDKKNYNEISLIKLVENKVKREDWFKNCQMYDEKQLVEDNGDELIIQTKDNYEIRIKFENDETYVTYISKGTDYKTGNETIIDVKYNGNGGVLLNLNTEMIIKEKANSTIILPKNSFTYTMYDFAGWIDEDGNEYQVGDKYTIKDETVQFWAKWEYKIKEELSCLITTGNQYINTDYIPNQDTSIEIQIQLLSRKTQFIYGNRQEEAKNSYALMYNAAEEKEGFRSDYGSNSNKQITTKEYEGIQTIKKEKNKTYINGVLKYTHRFSTFSTASSSVNNELFLFNVDTNGNINDSYYSKIKFYYCKIWDGDILVRDFIPVIDNKGVICILDKVESKLYYAQYGNENEEFKQEKDTTEISSTICDGNQYIDTGLRPNQDTTVEMKLKMGYYTGALFGARSTQFSKTFTCFFIRESGKIRFDYNTIQTSYSGYTYGMTYTIKQDKNNFYINGIKKGSTTYNPFNCDHNLYLFAVNTSETTGSKAKVDCLYCKIWDRGALVRDYVPVLDSNNIVCLYDKVEQKYYYGQGANLLMGKE